MLKKLPAYKGVILRCIDSCITHDQLYVSHDMMELFRLRFSGWITATEMLMHYEDLDNHYNKKLKQLRHVA